VDHREAFDRCDACGELSKFQLSRPDVNDVSKGMKYDNVTGVCERGHHMDRIKARAAWPDWHFT
jgi:hypothetical protein